MIEAEGIEGISFSFTAGVCISAILGLCPGTVSSLVLCAVPASLWLFLRPGRMSGPACVLSFVLLGILSHSCQQWPCGRTAPLKPLLDRLCALIDGISFRNDSSGALVKALLTGVKDSLSPEIRDAFRNSGASHILALSGMHLGVIYLILSKFSAVAGNSPAASRIRSVAVCAACGFYTMLTGAGPSVTRAFIFICLNEAARQNPGRKRKPARIYCTALLIQLCLNPGSISSLSFQLSYLAMAGIILVYPRLQGLMKGFLWNSMAMSISCQMFTAPLVWFKFGSFPRYFLLSNLFGLPLSEAVIMVSVPVLALSSIGICPTLLLRCADKLCQALIFCLSTISSM